MAKKEETKVDFQLFLEHLEYLGYEIQYRGDKEDEQGIYADHHKRPTLWVFKRFVGVGISIAYCMGKNAVTYAADYLKIINDFNRKSIVGAFYTDNEADRPNLRICAIFAAQYNKKTFGIFMDDLYRDHDEMKNTSDFDFYAEDDTVEIMPTAQVS